MYVNPISYVKLLILNALYLSFVSARLCLVIVIYTVQTTFLCCNEKFLLRLTRV